MHCKSITNLQLVCNGILHIYYKFIVNLQLICNGFLTKPLQICSKFTTHLLWHLSHFQIIYRKSIIKLQHICNRFGIVLGNPLQITCKFVTHLQLICHRPKHSITNTLQLYIPFVMDVAMEWLQIHYNSIAYI